MVVANPNGTIKFPPQPINASLSCPPCFPHTPAQAGPVPIPVPSEWCGGSGLVPLISQAHFPTLIVYAEETQLARPVRWMAAPPPRHARPLHMFLSLYGEWSLALWRAVLPSSGSVHQPAAIPYSLPLFPRSREPQRSDIRSLILSLWKAGWQQSEGLKAQCVSQRKGR